MEGNEMPIALGTAPVTVVYVYDPYTRNHLVVDLAPKPAAVIAHCASAPDAQRIVTALQTPGKASHP